jgi:hypothetical protein
MKLQQERIDAHCQMLKLEGLMQCYHAFASEAANRDGVSSITWSTARP